jgi:hypothetical protein
MTVPVVILVGGSQKQKTKFYTHFTSGIYTFPTTRFSIRSTDNTSYNIILIDTPGLREFQREYEYCWEGIFRLANIILNFGDWSPDYVYGTRPKDMPIMMTWSGDHNETMERIINRVQ